MVLLLFLLVSTIASLAQSLLISIVSVALMMADPKYYELALNENVTSEDITKYAEEFTKNLPDWILAVSLFGCIFMILASIIYCKKFEKRKAYTFGFATKGFGLEYLVGLLIGAAMISLPVLFCFATGCVTFSFGKRYTHRAPSLFLRVSHSGNGRGGNVPRLSSYLAGAQK